MKTIVTTAVASGLCLLAACTNGGYGTVTGQSDTTGLNGNPGGSSPPPQPASNVALFRVSAGQLPYPYDVYFAGSTDGTLNIQPVNPFIPAQAAVNGLDGFSTTAPIRERFAGPIDAASLGTPGAVVIVHINTNNLTKAPVSPLQGGTFVPLAGCVKSAANCTAANFDYAVAPAADDPTILEITPLKPLSASTCLPPAPGMASPCAVANGGNGAGYMVLLTKAITVGGVPTVADTDYASFQAAIAAGGPTCPSITNAQLNAICQLSAGHLALAQAVLKINPANVVVSFSFSTESTLDTLAAAASEATPQPIKVNFTGLTTAAFQGLGFADVYVGVITLPYYLSKTNPDTEYWHASAATAPDKTSTITTRFNPFPVATVKALQVPVLMTVPNMSSGQSKPAGGWPIVVFEHGYPADRTNLLGIADSLAHGGFVGITIDLPLHGCTPPFTTSPACAPLYATSTNPLYAGLGLPAAGSIERTFDLTTLSGGSAIDPTGSHYIAPFSLLTTRDNIRESSVDLVTLAESVGTIALPSPATAPYIDPTRVHYMGHSMGGIVGPGFLAVMPPNAVLTATLANPGGEFIYLGIESPRFGPPIIALLEKSSGGLLTPGTTLFAQFARDAQSIIDSGDPWNYIAQAAALHPIHMIEVIGPPPDNTVPNDSTDRLIAAGGFTQASPPGIPLGVTPLHKVVKFTAGNHSSFLLPTASLMATEEMQLEAVSFAVANGLALPVTPGAPVQ